MVVSAVQKPSVATSTVAKPRSLLDGFVKVGGDVYRHILSFCDINTPITSTCTVTKITPKDKAKQFEEHLASKGTITWQEIEEWERLKGRKLTSFRSDDPQVAFVKKITHFGDNAVMPSFGITLYLGMFPNLTSIELAGITITPLLVNYINRHFPHLEKLACHGCHLTDPPVSAGEVVRNLRQLKSFIWTSYQISEEDVDKIIDYCPGLTHLVLSGCGLTDRGIGRLSRLKATLSDLDISYNPVTQVGVAFALTNLINLRKLDIKGIDIQNYGDLIRHRFCDELEEFTFDGSLDDANIKIFADYFPKLKKFSFKAHNSENALFYLLDSCDELQTLDFDYFYFSEEGLSRFLDYVDSRPLLLANLRPLNIPSLIAEQQLRTLARHRSTIVELSLSTPAISNAIVQDIASLPALRRLTLNDVSVTDLGLEAISQLPLDTIKLENCPFIHQDGLQRLIQNSKSLETLDLIKMNVGDDFLHSLSNLSSLRYLRIEDDRTITFEGLSHLLLSSPNIVNLFLHNVSISHDEIIALRERFPNTVIQQIL
ncbi:MAG TPA: hypothetical protein VLG44_04300 [Chlamydiales bacterium]|nr:hypothetical protein [Chlamydiales bacterium]